MGPKLTFKFGQLGIQIINDLIPEPKSPELTLFSLPLSATAKENFRVLFLNVFVLSAVVM